MSDNGKKNKREEIEKEGGGNVVFFCSHLFPSYPQSERLEQANDMRYIRVRIKKIAFT